MDNYKLPQQTKIGYAHLRVSSLARSLQFYGDLLGMQPLREEDHTTALTAAEEKPPFLFLSALPEAKPRSSRTAGLYHIAIRYPDRAALGWVMRRLVEAGYPLGGAADHLVSEALYMDDPDGNGVELYRDRPRDEWVHQGDTIAMATDPLDARGVMEAGLKVHAEKAPPETDLGHIHLQASDLDRIEQFYHQLVGLDITQRGYPGALFLSAGGYHHHVGANTWAGRGIPPTPQDAPGLSSFSLALPDRASQAALADRLREHLSTVEEITLPVWGEAWRVPAPDGIWLDLVAAP